MAYNSKKPVTKKIEEPEILVEMDNDIDDIGTLRKQLLSTQNQLDELRQLMITKSEEPTQKENSVKFDSMDRWCTIVHLEDRAEGLYTIFRSSLIEYRFSFFGETRKVRRIELDDIISRNRKLFERVMLTLGAEDGDLIVEYGLPDASKIILNPRQLAVLPTLSPEDLKKLYDKVCDTHKQLIVRKWVTGYYENKDGNYRNINKINLLNDLSNGALSHIIDDINETRRTKRS